jgi:hypothetical protein
VIDFWLGSAVFPIESKQFRYKLAASAWDMTCNNSSTSDSSGNTSQQSARVTATGFSGTNDARLLLPLSIQQCDLPSLQGMLILQSIIQSSVTRHALILDVISTRMRTTQHHHYAVNDNRYKW